MGMFDADYMDWDKNQIARWKSVWAKIKDPKYDFKWSEVLLPPPRSWPDVAQIAAKRGFAAGLGWVTEQTAVSKVWWTHSRLMSNLAEGQNLKDALQTLFDTNIGNWHLFGCSNTEAEVFIMMLILERTVYADLSPLSKDPEWDSKGNVFVKWVSMRSGAGAGVAQQRAASTISANAPKAA